MNPSPRPYTPLRGLLGMLWKQPLWAVPFALFFGTLYGSGLHGYVHAYKISFVFSWLIGLSLWVVRSFIAPRIERSRDRSETAAGVRMMLAYGSAAMIGSYAAATIVHFTLLPGFLGSTRAVLISGMFSLLFTALFSGISVAISSTREAIEKARAVEQVKRELAEAELRALRAQIHPHFLFNTLNSIASLIGTDPRVAEDTTTRLADLFRYTLTASDREHVRLSEELEFLRNYLEIERTRFGDRLRVEESIEPGLESVPVPALLLQPVVENAVRYAVSERSEGALVRLAARREGDTLVLEVTDNGPGMDGAAASSGTGFGLHSVRERLRLAGPPHAIDIESQPGKGTLVRLRLPLQPRTASGVSDSGVPS